ncbi:MAG: hypothetical protein IKR31_02360 [Prevotella sp.]|nr:hypothetical protein [Prevotella sp.]
MKKIFYLPLMACLLLIGAAGCSSDEEIKNLPSGLLVGRWELVKQSSTYWLDSTAKKFYDYKYIEFTSEGTCRYPRLANIIKEATGDYPKYDFRFSNDDSQITFSYDTLRVSDHYELKNDSLILYNFMYGVAFVWGCPIISVYKKQ